MKEAKFYEKLFHEVVIVMDYNMHHKRYIVDQKWFYALHEGVNSDVAGSFNFCGT